MKIFIFINQCLAILGKTHAKKSKNLRTLQHKAFAADLWDCMCRKTGLQYVVLRVFRQVYFVLSCSNSPAGAVFRFFDFFCKGVLDIHGSSWGDFITGTKSPVIPLSIGSPKGVPV